MMPKRAKAPRGSTAGSLGSGPDGGPGPAVERDDRKLARRLRRLEGKLQAAQARERKRRHRVESARIRGKGIKKAQRRLDEARADVRSILERIERVAEQDAGPTSITARAMLDSEHARADHHDVELQGADGADGSDDAGRAPAEMAGETVRQEAGAAGAAAGTVLEPGGRVGRRAVRREETTTPATTRRRATPARPRTRPTRAATAPTEAVPAPAVPSEPDVSPEAGISEGPDASPEPAVGEAPAVSPEPSATPGPSIPASDAGPEPDVGEAPISGPGPETQPEPAAGAPAIDQTDETAIVVEVVTGEVPGDSSEAIVEAVVSLDVAEEPEPAAEEPEPAAEEPELAAEAIQEDAVSLAEEPAPATETAATGEPRAETEAPTAMVSAAEGVPAAPTEPLEPEMPQPDTTQPETPGSEPPSESSVQAAPDATVSAGGAAAADTRQAADAVVAAAVDIGANSVHLLVAVVRDHRLEPLVDESVFLGLGTAADSGSIGEANRGALVAALTGYADAARQLGARVITFVGTDPLRRAGDARRVVMEVERRTGVPLHVLSHEEEACLNLIGVTGGAPITTDLGVLDIGGGSSELVVATPGKRPRAIPIPLGSARLTDRSVTTDPPTLDAIEAMRATARHEVEAAAPAVIHELVAVGGTASNLVRLSSAATTDRILTRARLGAAIDALLAEPAEAISERYLINPLRPRLLPAGAAILEAVLDRYGLESVRVSDAGIREGAALVAAQAGEAWRDRLGELVNGWLVDEEPAPIA
jgi:hypothetical protein